MMTKINKMNIRYDDEKGAILKTLFSVLSIIILVVMIIGVVIYFTTEIFYKPFGVTPLFFLIFVVASKSKKFQE